MNRQLRLWTPRRATGWTIAVVAVAVAAVHWIAHIGYRPIPLGVGAQDIPIGYPAAVLLGLTAVVLLGQTSTTRH